MKDRPDIRVAETWQTTVQWFLDQHRAAFLRDCVKLDQEWMPQAALFYEYSMEDERQDPPQVGILVSLPFGQQTGNALLEKHMFIGTTRLAAVATGTIASITAYEGWASQDPSTRPSQAADRFSILIVVTAHRDFGCRIHSAIVEGEGKGRTLRQWEPSDEFDEETGLGAFVPPPGKAGPNIREWARTALRMLDGSVTLRTPDGWKN